MSDETYERTVAEAEAIIAALGAENDPGNRVAAYHIASELLGYKAEIAGLKAALETAHAERDAALSIVKEAVDAGKAATRNGAKIAQSGRGYYVATPSGCAAYSEIQFIAAWESFVRNSNTAPQPAAAPAVDAAPDIAQLLLWASNSHEHASGHAAMVEDDRARCAIEAHGLAIRHLIDAVTTMQKGEPR